jgi:[acyl-carrier-protein] S-malonyltransferase
MTKSMTKSMTEQIVSTTAFIFPGQGTQSLGMGRALAREFPEARQVFEEADQAIAEITKGGLDVALSRLCFEGPEDQLQRTEITQPAILTTSIAALRVLEARTDIRPKVALGHSLGEISALVAVGSIRFATAVKLAWLRGKAMQESVPDGGSMAAIIGLPLDQVEAMCAEASTETEVVTPANLNGGNQIVIAGHFDAVERVADAAHEADGRAVTLKVSAPFHCALMEPAAERLDHWLGKVDVMPMRAPVISCVDAEPIEDPARVRGLLVAQVTHRVRWEEAVRKAFHMGAERAVELGNGKVLRGLLRRIDRGFKVYSLGEPDDLDKLPKD